MILLVFDITVKVILIVIILVIVVSAVIHVTVNIIDVNNVVALYVINPISESPNFLHLTTFISQVDVNQLNWAGIYVDPILFLVYISNFFK